MFSSNKHYNDRVTDPQLFIACFSMALLLSLSSASIESAEFPPMGRSAKRSVLEMEGMYSGGYRRIANSVGRLCHCSCSRVTKIRSDG